MVKQKFMFLVKSMMVKLLIYHTGMCIKGLESWWMAKSITREIVSGPLITAIKKQ